MRKIPRVLLFICLVSVLSGCCGLTSNVSRPSGKVDLSIVSGSENESLEPLIQKFAKKQGYQIHITYQGSVDIMLGLESETFEFDAVWPAHSLWISLGDEALHRVKHVESIMRSPVVFGIKRSLAEELGFVGRDVTVGDILEATEQGKLRFMMTNATQSNSGATAYLGFIYSFLGGPDVITAQDLDDPELEDKLVKLLSAVNRSSGSSGWLKDLYLESEGRYDGMVNYESMVIELNQELAKKGQEPLYVVYPVDGQAISDSPLGYVNKGDEKKEEIFLQLQEYLLSESVQEELLKNGRRAGLVGLDASNVDKKVFNPDWGIDTERVINQIRLPKPEVIRKALDMYQLVFRKPSLTVFCLDYSGSMEGEGERAMEEAMAFLLDQGNASRYMIQTGPDDLTIIVPFAGQPAEPWAIKGNDPTALNDLLNAIQSREPKGGTDIYLPVVKAFEMMQEIEMLDAYQPAVILMTDGRSNSTKHMRTLTNAWEASGLDVPVFGILFGEADAKQMDKIAELTRGRVFDGTHDLVKAFRKAKGYN